MKKKKLYSCLVLMLIVPVAFVFVGCGKVDASSRVTEQQQRITIQQNLDAFAEMVKDGGSVTIEADSDGVTTLRLEMEVKFDIAAEFGLTQAEVDEVFNFIYVTSLVFDENQTLIGSDNYLLVELTLDDCTDDGELQLTSGGGGCGKWYCKNCGYRWQWLNVVVDVLEGLAKIAVLVMIII